MEEQNGQSIRPILLHLIKLGQCRFYAVHISIIHFSFTNKSEWLVEHYWKSISEKKLEKEKWVKKCYRK